MTWPGARDLLFSLKAFAAAMLAFWIACALNLSRPVWAIFTVYMLMQPISGAVRSKAALPHDRRRSPAAAIALLLMALLADLPGALFLALGLVAMLGVFLRDDRPMPRGYVYSMAGITAAVIGLPDTLDPLAGFDTVDDPHRGSAARHRLRNGGGQRLLPAPGRRRAQCPRRCMAGRQRRDYTLDALRGRTPATPAIGDWRSSPPMPPNSTRCPAHVAYDSVPNRPSPRVVRLLHTRMLLLIRLMFAPRTGPRLLRDGPAATAPMRRAVAALSDWVRDMPAASSRTLARKRTCDRRSPPMSLADAFATLRRQPGPDAAQPDARLRGLSGVAARGRRRHAVAGSSASRCPASNGWRSRIAIRCARCWCCCPSPSHSCWSFGYWTATAWEQGATAALMTLVAGAFASAAAEASAHYMRVLAMHRRGGRGGHRLSVRRVAGRAGFPVLIVVLGLFLVPAGAFIPITRAPA